MSNKGKRVADRKDPVPSPATRPSFAQFVVVQAVELLRLHLGKAITFVGIGYMVKQVSVAMMAFAGKQSNANMMFGFLADIELVFAASILLSGVSVGLYLRERTQHRQTRKRLAARITDLELVLDPTRTSSQLTEEGLTREEDR